MKTCACSVKVLRYNVHHYFHQRRHVNKDPGYKRRLAWPHFRKKISVTTRKGNHDALLVSVFLWFLKLCQLEVARSTIELHFGGEWEREAFQRWFSAVRQLLSPSGEVKVSNNTSTPCRREVLLLTLLGFFAGSPAGRSFQRSNNIMVSFSPP
jgi:hypothetical protein